MGNVSNTTPLVPTIIESPYAGDVEANLTYVRQCMHDCLMRGEAPYASHALYTQVGVLDDLIPVERELGIAAGFAYRDLCPRTAVYLDLGVSKGMEYGIDHAQRPGHETVYRAFLDGLNAPAVDVDVTNLPDEVRISVAGNSDQCVGHSTLHEATMLIPLRWPKAGRHGPT